MPVGNDPFAAWDTIAKILPIAFLGVFLLCRLWPWRKRRRFRPSYGSLGNALQVLQTIARSQVEYELEEKLKEKADEDDEAGPDDPVAYYRRKMKEVDHTGPMRPEKQETRSARRTATAHTKPQRPDISRKSGRK